MSALQGLALNAFLERRHERARRLFAASRSRAAAGLGDGSSWPDPVHGALADIVEQALTGDTAAGSSALLEAVDRVGTLLDQLPSASTSRRERFAHRTAQRAGFELARLAGRGDLMRRFGPPMTVAEAAWQIQADPEFFAEASGDVPEELDDETTPESDDPAASVTPEHLAAAARRTTPSLRFAYPQYVFAALDQQAQVRFSSPRSFQSFEARLSHTGLQTSRRTSFTLRPTAPSIDVVDRIVDEIRGQQPAVRFEFASHDDGLAQVAAFREATVGRAADGIELMLDLDKAAFKTDQRPEEVWRALGSNSPVTVAIVL